MLDCKCIKCGKLLIAFSDPEAALSGISVSTSLSCPFCGSRNISYTPGRDFVINLTSMAICSLKTNGTCRPRLNPVTQTDFFASIIFDCLELFCDMHPNSSFEQFLTKAINKHVTSEQIIKNHLIRAGVLIYEQVNTAFSRKEMADYL